VSFDYAKSAATALRLIKRFGAPAAIVTTTSVYDPDSDTNVNTPVSTACIACVIDAEKSHIDGTLIQTGHRVALVPPQGIDTPKPGAKLLWEGVQMQVAIVKTLAPAGVAVLHELQVRG
jgi:hypothetical protein